ncbi:helicase, putative [Eimeria brunetti]|uniref:Helicase, putative n=1 Tax=Eimeria brunetti TaxID=51314 RepID=U6LYG1_9EIME|nr:helicase, putative [Eimeria brunetti]
MQKQGKRQEIKDFLAVVAAGRQQLCLHPDVCSGIRGNSSSSNGSSDLGDKCSYLVSKGLCSYYKNKHLVSDAAVAATLDIEDLRRIGKSVGGCPYYGCRAAAAQADVVLLPFSLAFPADGNTTEGGIVSLAGSLFCVDEAHHLSSALSSSKSAALSHETAASAARLLALYIKHFSSRLAPQSLHLLKQLSRFVETIYKRLQVFCCCGHGHQLARQQQQQHHHAVDGSHVSPFRALAGSPEAGAAGTTAASRGADHAGIPAGDDRPVLTATELLRLFKLDNFDLHELIAFLSDPSRRICQKMRGFAMYHNNKFQQSQQKQQQAKRPHMQQQNNQEHYTEQHILEPSCLYTVKNFLCSLLGMDTGDRLIITSLHQHLEAGMPTEEAPPGAADWKAADETETKFTSGSSYCCCRLEVVCLAAEKALEPILSSSCPDFCFEFSQRMHFPEQFVSFLRLLLCVSGSVSGGVVVFFPSFATLQLFLAVAGIAGGPSCGDAAAAGVPIVEGLKKLGPIFAERRTPGPTKTDAGIRIAYGAALWQLYTSAVLGGDLTRGTQDAGGVKCTRTFDFTCNERSRRDDYWRDERHKAACAEKRTPSPKTAFLFCVMGGRLSEGVNFSDALARLLVVVGMPFPCIKDKIFILHKQHYNEIMMKQQASGDGTQEAGRVLSFQVADAGQLQQQQKEQPCVDYGLLQCMITVNQTIGRAIRHSKDYAAILLVDRRYSLARVQNLLPRWLLQSVGMGSTAGGEKWRDHLTASEVERGAEDGGEAIRRRLQLFFGPLE